MSAQPGQEAPWVRPLRVDPDACLRLFCFPYAGAGPAVFREWPALIRVGTEVLGIEYPGREARAVEQPLTDLRGLVVRLLPGLLPWLDKPFVFFGHSMGALVAYETTRALVDTHNLLPELLVVSAAGAPHCPQPLPICELPTKEFLRALLRLNGMPVALLQDRDLLARALPVLRADFKLCETYRYVPGTPLICPILALGGATDPRVDLQRLSAWRHHAAAAFKQSIVAGDHFFICSNRTRVLGALNQELGTLIDALSGS